jgi:phospholipid/cholesterol/gamma-HCH transport system substrate-binding protein
MSVEEHVSPARANGRAAGDPSRGGATRRSLSVNALLAGLVLVGVVLCTILIFGIGDSSYTLHALFEDSGQLVSGGEVQIAGRSVGAISGISVTPNGLADVTLSIDDGSIVPLHRGTRAIIRAVGQAGVANRFVQLSPGAPSAPTLRSGATLSTAQTTGIVDLDAVLDTFDPATRASIQQLIGHSAQIFAGSGAKYFGETIGRLDPAMAELSSLTGQIATDRVELGQVVHSGAVAVSAVASRSLDLQDTVAHTASALGAIATERAPLADLLQRSPAVLTQATSTLQDVSAAVTALRPTLRLVVPVASPLKHLLTVLPPTLARATPAVANLNAQLPDIRTALTGFKPLEKLAVPALTTTSTALKTMMPVLAGVREYGSDFFLGVFNGLAGISTGNYNSTGHYVHLEFVEPYQTLLSGFGTQLLSALPNDLFAERNGLTSRCPGGNEPPAPDGSNPWVIKGLCNPADDVPLSVDFPP